MSISFGISVSFGISNQQSSLDGVDFTLKLHSKPCALNGGPVYQHPFLCPDGCTQAEVDAAAGTAEPLEVSFTTQMNTASANEASITYDWPVYVPEFYNGESRYVLLSSPRPPPPFTPLSRVIRPEVRLALDHIWALFSLTG